LVWSTSVIERLTSQGNVGPWQIVEVVVRVTNPFRTQGRSKPDAATSCVFNVGEETATELCAPETSAIASRVKIKLTRRPIAFAFLGLIKFLSLLIPSATS
jgi:hypothetical protein